MGMGRTAHPRDSRHKGELVLLWG